MRQLILLVVLSCASSCAHAHRDRILSVQADGTIPEIPEEHGRVALETDFSLASPAIRFTVGDLTTVVPGCVAKLVLSQSIADVQLTGSWYHERETLPYYVKAVFFEAGTARSPKQHRSIAILFNIETSEIIHVDLRDGRERAVRNGRFSVSDLCNDPSQGSN